MKTIAMTCPGSVDVLCPMELAKPVPLINEILVRVRSTSVNPADLRARTPSAGKGFAQRCYPAVLGFDFCGYVESVGSAVTEFKEGDEVIGSPHLFRNGANAEYVTVDSRVVAKRPHRLTTIEAGAIPLVALTSFNALIDRAKIRCGQTVLVQGGSGGVGHIAVQLAKSIGCTVIATAGRSESISYCRDVLEADYVINYRDESAIEQIRGIVGKNGVDVILDTVGGDSLARYGTLIAPLGQIVTIVPTSFKGAHQAAFANSATVHYEMMSARLVHDRDVGRMGFGLRHMGELFDAGVLNVHVSSVFPISQLRQAHAALEAGSVIGKIAVDVENGWI